jgi:sarcosine oxidase, subunit alpha
VSDYRITRHPILPPADGDLLELFWAGRPVAARSGESIAAALYAAGIRSFGQHHRDGAPQGLFCANGQCSQCLVLADGRPVKACMTTVRPGLRLEPLDGLPVLPLVDRPVESQPIAEVTVPVLIIGGGPAGLAAATELGRQGVKTLLIDDRERLGGKLVLQTHRFFGSVEAVHAGTRGIDIATRLEKDVRSLPDVQIWLRSTALAVYSDRRVGILREGGEYVLVRPHVLLVAAGAREQSLAFPGNTLPGVIGAGAFQTLANRDRVRPAERVFILGGGNVGLIAGYHALQAGITVVGLAEIMPEVGGYRVHKDKLARLGVPVYTSHTILSANGHRQVESVTIAGVDADLRPIPGTERSYACDTLLVAVGLDPISEFYAKAQAFGMTALAAGDAAEIAEASAAIFSGRIRGREAAQALGIEIAVPTAWRRLADVLKAKPAGGHPEHLPRREHGVFPILHCTQEIPCDPCRSACPKGLIHLEREDDIRSLPVFHDAEPEGAGCAGCELCVARCPGLAITMVDYRQDPASPTVTVAYELEPDALRPGELVTAVDTKGRRLGEVEVAGVKRIKANDRTALLHLVVPRAYARKVAGVRMQPEIVTMALVEPVERLENDAVVCRCGRVTLDEIRALVRQGHRDVNAIKALAHASMGACGGNHCGPLIRRILREEGVPAEAIVENTKRPLFTEVPLGLFAGAREGEDGLGL